MEVATTTAQTDGTCGLICVCGMVLFYHDDVGVDVVGSGLIRVPVVQNHTGVVDWKDTNKQTAVSSTPGLSGWPL